MDTALVLVDVLLDPSLIRRGHHCRSSALLRGEVGLLQRHCGFRFLLVCDLCTLLQLALHRLCVDHLLVQRSLERRKFLLESAYAILQLLAALRDFLSLSQRVGMLCNLPDLCGTALDLFALLLCPNLACGELLRGALKCCLLPFFRPFERAPLLDGFVAFGDSVLVALTTLSLGSDGLQHPGFDGHAPLSRNERAKDPLKLSFGAFYGLGL